VVGVFLVAQRRRGGPEASYLHQRSLEVYRSLLASSLADGPLGEERLRDLASARARLGLSPREHEALFAIASMEETSAAGREVLLGRYEVLRSLGAGGQATVELARDRQGGGLVVLKRYRSSALGSQTRSTASLREFEVARRVSHPNLVAIHDLVPSDGETIIVMEHAEGGSLRDLLDRSGSPSEERATALLREALDGLQAVHDAGIIHGDLKPENVLLTREGRVKLTDFGVARMQPGHRTLVHATLGVPGGTLGYLSPEVLRGSDPSLSSDIYAMGRLAHELLTGLPPGHGASSASHGRRPTEPQGLPPGWAEFIGKATAEEPRDRFPSAVAMASALPGGRAAATRAEATGGLPPSRRTRSEV
jgi:serine/threonine-protein kinase